MMHKVIRTIFGEEQDMGTFNPEDSSDAIIDFEDLDAEFGCTAKYRVEKIEEAEEEECHI